MCGDTERIRRRQREPREEFSFLFNSHSQTLESTYSARGLRGWQSTLTFEVSGAPSSALENPEARLICTPGRTHNRIRSPR